jgi:hypothetical protein
VGVDAGIVSGDFDFFVCGPRAQGVERVEPGQAVFGGVLDDRRDFGSAIKSGNRDIGATIVDLKGQRRAAVATEAAADFVGRAEMLQRAAGQCEIVADNVGTADAAVRLLAHAAMAQRRPAELGDAKADRTALAAAGVGLGCGFVWHCSAHLLLNRSCCRFIVAALAAVQASLPLTLDWWANAHAGRADD